MSFLGIASLFAAGSGAFKFAKAYGHNQETKRIVEKTNQDYSDADDKLTKQAMKTDASTEQLGKLRYKAWSKDMKKFLDAYNKFSGVKIKGNKLAKYSTGYSVSNNVSLNELYYLSNGAEALALSSVAGFAGGTLATWGVYSLVSQLGAAATTGTAICTLSGAASHNATMAYIGGGALSIGGGGMAAGASSLLGFGLGTCIGISGWLTEYQLRNKKEQVILQSNLYYEKINEMKQICDNMRGLCWISNKYIEFHNQFSELFLNLINETNDIYWVAKERKTLFQRIFGIKVKKVNVRKLSLKELKVLQLLGFAAQIYYGLISIPLSDNNYAIDEESRSLLLSAEEMYHLIKEVLNDIHLLSDEEFKEKYEGHNNEIKPLVFKVPDKIKLRKKKGKKITDSNKAMFANLGSLLVVLLTYIVFGFIAYFGYTTLNVKWYFYLIVFISFIFTWPGLKVWNSTRRAFVRLIQLCVGLIIFGLTVFLVDYEVYEAYRQLLMEVLSFSIVVVKNFGNALLEWGRSTYSFFIRT